MKKYYYIHHGTEGANRKVTRRIESLDETIREAEKLAKLNPGMDMEILQCIGITRSAETETIWANETSPTS